MLLVVRGADSGLSQKKAGEFTVGLSQVPETVSNNVDIDVTKDKKSKKVARSRPATRRIEYGRPPKH